MTVSMAPEAGLEPATRRLIPTSRDSNTEQVFSDPTRRFHALYLPLTSHGRSAGDVFFAPDQLPWPIPARKLSEDFVGTIMGMEPRGKIVCVTHVRLSSEVLQDIHPIHDSLNGSRGRARTCNPPVNSRLLYH